MDGIYGFHTWRITASYLECDARYPGLDSWEMENVSCAQAWTWGQEHYSRGPGVVASAVVISVELVS